jgi:predicted porin
LDGASKRDWQEVDNSSRIGFAGEEDLGGGNKAIFRIESRLRRHDRHLWQALLGS